MIDGKMRRPKDPLPDPFGQTGKYAIRVLYETTMKNEPQAFKGKLTSNTVNISVK